MQTSVAPRPGHKGQPHTGGAGPLQGGHMLTNSVTSGHVRSRPPTSCAVNTFCEEDERPGLQARLGPFRGIRHIKRYGSGILMRERVRRGGCRHLPILSAAVGGGSKGTPGPAQRHCTEFGTKCGTQGPRHARCYSGGERGSRTKGSRLSRVSPARCRGPRHCSRGRNTPRRPAARVPRGDSTCGRCALLPRRRAPGRRAAVTSGRAGATWRAPGARGSAPRAS
jgi:hypothetical protein